MGHDFGWTDAIAIFAVFGAGLISGQMVAIALANTADCVLPEANWTRRFQLENVLFTKTMPIALMAPFLALIACSVTQAGISRLWFVASTVMLAIVLAITIGVNVPINDEVAGWGPDAAPATWTTTRDRWLRFHRLRTAIGVLSFACATIAIGLR